MAPGDVSPGHMMLAPLSTNLIAPLSTCSIGRMNGYLWRSFNVGIHGPSLCRKNKRSPLPLTIISMWSWHLTSLKISFLGNMTSRNLSKHGYCSKIFVLIPFWTEDFSCWTPDILSFSSNLKNNLFDKLGKFKFKHLVFYSGIVYGGYTWQTEIKYLFYITFFHKLTIAKLQTQITLHASGLELMAPGLQVPHLTTVLMCNITYFLNIVTRKYFSNADGWFLVRSRLNDTGDMKVPFNCDLRR